MGVGAAMIMPVTLSVITTVFPPEERGKAVGTWVGVAAGGGVLGLLASGVLLEWLPWQSIFVLNVVLATVALAGTLAIVPATREARPPRLDPVGTLLSVVGARGARLRHHRRPRARLGRPVDGRPRSALGVVGAGRVRRSGSCAAASRCSTRATSCRRGFGAGSLSITVQFFAVFGFLFLALPYLQLVMGYSPLAGGRRALPMALVVIPLSRIAPAIAARSASASPARRAWPDGDRLHRPLDARASARPTAHFLAACCRSAPAWRSPARRRRPRSSRRCRASKQGVASAVNDVSRELGGALGIAVLGSVMNSVYRAEMADSTANLPAGAGEKATGSLAAAQQIGEQLGPQGHQLVVHAQTAFLHGFTHGLIGGAAVLLLGALFVAVRAPGRAESRSNATGKAIGGVAADGA